MSASVHSPSVHSSTSEHRHSTGLCPVIGPDSRAYCPPQKGDSRSPCPALNTLANHGYLPRDGKCITPQVLMHALEQGYNLSGPLAWVLVRGGFYLLGQRRERICLRDLARHNCIEHNASLIHRDAHERDEYAPIRNHLEMMDLLLSHSEDGVLMTTDDVARARVHRELEYENAMDRLHAEIARGEMAIVLNLFNNPAPSEDAEAGLSSSRSSLLSKAKRVLGIKPKPQTAPLPGVPNDILRTWMLEERLPDDWRPYHKTGLLHVIRTSTHLRHSMEATEKELDVNKVRRENTLLRKQTALAIAAAEAEEDEFNVELEQGEIGDMPLTESPLPSRRPTALIAPSPSMHNRTPTSTTASSGPRTPTESEFSDPAVASASLIIPDVPSLSPPPFVKRQVLLIDEVKAPLKETVVEPTLGYSSQPEQVAGAVEMPRLVAVAN